VKEDSLPLEQLKAAQHLADDLKFAGDTPCDLGRE